VESARLTGKGSSKTRRFGWYVEGASLDERGTTKRTTIEEHFVGLLKIPELAYSRTISYRVVWDPYNVDSVRYIIT